MNMAIDEAILEAHLLGLVPPTLRFYGWQPEAVSIGYAQRIDRQQQERISAHGFEIVRRPTGGRAVLHSGDLTYSFVGTSAFLDENVTRAYKQISQALIQGLAHLGVEASLGGTDANYRDVHDCFLAVTGADLQVNGKKLVGSAQLRRHQGVLQHGSILLQQDQKLMARLFSASEESEGTKELKGTEGSKGPERLERLEGLEGLEGLEALPGPDRSDFQRHANLYDLIGRRSITEIEAALAKGFEEAFAKTFNIEEFSPCELSSAQKAAARFALPSLNQV
jgi:lipoate---protein ligase